ncbi:MAG: histidine kinase [Nostoc sp.]|uniref:histidine kinase n=1 Tax=Nostoc sp. TaxID=1180 RepID=UPI002FF6AA0C
MNKIRSEFKYYLVSVISVAIALILTLTIENLFERSLIGLFLAAVAITSWYGGMNPGIVAVVLSTIACHYYVFSPVDSIATMTPASFVWNAQFVLVASSICYLTGRLRFITQRLTHTNQILESEIQERIKAEAELRESEAALRNVYDELRLRKEELQLITDALPALISYVDTHQRYQFVNRAYEVWFQCHRDAILGKTVRELMDEAYVIAAPNIERAQTGQITTYEAEISYPIGKRYIMATFIPDLDHKSRVKGHYGLVTDISEQRNAALRERKRAEEASILEERNRMAREIHDTLAQSFTGIIIHARTAANKLTVNPEKAQASLAQVQNLARTGLAEARRSVEALRPSLLENNDLPSAFKHLTHQLESFTSTIISCEAIGSPYLLPSDVENNLLRIGQEALTNALKYAKATEIRVELLYQPTHCLLRIKDDGQGFIVDRSSGHNGFGLLGMGERADQIRAQLQIQSTPGQGTEITVSVNQEKP